MGGRSSAGGNAKASAEKRAEARKREVNSDSKVQELLTAANKNWQSGEVYGENEEETFKIGYEVDQYYNIRQTSDGQIFDDSRVQRMVEGQDSGKFHAFNANGDILVTSSAAKAAKWAWGTPKSLGYKKYKK